MALVYKDGKFMDEETARFTAQEYARGHSFFTYMSDTVDSLSSCCFEENTPVIYVKPEDFETNKYSYESIKTVYDAYKDQTVKVYQETIDDTTGTPYCKGNWVDADVIKATAVQEVEIYLAPIGITIDEHDNIMKVTPDHIFPVLTKDGIVDKYAYLLETGDKLCFEREQMDVNLGMEEVSGDTEEQMSFRSIAKVVVTDFNEPKNYYCFRIKDESLQPYFLLPNGCITHNCRLKNKIQTKEFNFTNGNMGVNSLGPLCA